MYNAVSHSPLHFLPFFVMFACGIVSRSAQRKLFCVLNSGHCDLANFACGIVLDSRRIVRFSCGPKWLSYILCYTWKYAVWYLLDWNRVGLCWLFFRGFQSWNYFSLCGISEWFCGFFRSVLFFRRAWIEMSVCTSSCRFFLSSLVQRSCGSTVLNQPSPKWFVISSKTKTFVFGIAGGFSMVINMIIIY